MVQMSYHLYSSRRFGPLISTLQMLKTTGFGAVEGYVDLKLDVLALRDALCDAGIRMTSMIVDLKAIETDPFRIVAIARTLCASKVFVKGLPCNHIPSDHAEWTDFANYLSKTGRVLTDAGLTFGWHNHDDEFQLTDRGSLPLDLIADAGLPLSLDIGWVGRAGLDPVAMINRFGDAISAVHLKDIAPLGDCLDEEGWADVGQGVLDWPAIHHALQAAQCDHYILQHNQPSNDARFAQNSLAYLNSVI